MIIAELTKSLEKAVKKSTGDPPSDLQITETTEKAFGDYSTNVALLLAKPLKKNPRELAEEIIRALAKGKLIEKTEIAGPGFINFWLKGEVFANAFEKLYKKIEQKKLGKLRLGKGKVAMTDTSHPNVAKPMGVHHLLSTVLGHTFNNLLKTSGYKLIRDNYLGDWGTQFGKLIVAIRKWGDMKVVEKNPIPELLKVYVKFHDEAEKDSSLEDQGRAEFKKLEDGDVENRKLWKWIREISVKEFQIIWKRLGVSFDMMNGESSYEEKMAPIIEEGVKKGIIQTGEGGALIIPMNKENMPPAIVRKSDGATTYLTRDLARIKEWEELYHCDLGINVVDVAQKLHFEQLFESAKKLGIQKKEQMLIDFGRMSFPEGGMSTRKGKVVLLEDVLDEGEKRALEKIKEHRTELPEGEQKELARKMGIGAIKYNILSQNRFKNYTFDWDQMLSFEGNSAPYLQYAYTRTQSVMRKAGVVIPTESAKADERRNLAFVQLKDPSASLGMTEKFEAEEKSLIKKLLNYESTIEQSLKQYKPNLLCTYLFELAQSFSHFYNNLRVLDAETEEKKSLRLALVVATGYVLKHGLEILGIEVPAKM